MDVYFFDLKSYSDEEINELFEKIGKIKKASVFIVDDAHLFPEECKKLIMNFKKNGKGWLIIGSRDSPRIMSHPKEFNEFQTIENIKIDPYNISSQLIELFLKRKHNLEDNKVRIAMNELETYKEDLWLLSWALLAYDPINDQINMSDVYQKIVESITSLGKTSSAINAEDILFVLSIFYRFEISVERKFIVQLGIPEQIISDLVSLGEIFENKRTRALSLAHSSVANLYYETYKESSGLGYNIRSKFRQDADQELFYQYLISAPFNFFRSIISLRFNTIDGKFSANLLKRLMDQKNMQNIFEDMIVNCENIADICMGILDILDISEDFLSRIANSPLIKILAYKLNNEQKAERIGLFIMVISNMDNEIKSKLVDLINISNLAQKMEHLGLFLLTSCLMNLYNANSKIAFCLVEEINKYDVDDFIDKINSEESLFIISFHIFYIAKSNKKLALKIVKSININNLINKSKDIDDAIHIELFIMTVSLLLTEAIPEIVGTIDIKAFRRVILSKIRNSDALHNSNFLFGIAIANRELALKLITETYEDDLVSIIGREKELKNIVLCILSLACIDRSLGLRIINKVDILNIILRFANKTESTDIVNFINIIAYLDRSKAFNIAIQAIVYSNFEVSQNLICTFSATGNIVNMDNYLRKSAKDIEIVINNGYIMGNYLLDQITSGWRFKISKI